MSRTVKEYLEQVSSPNKEICEKLIAIIKENEQGINEKMKWGVPNYGNDKYYVVSLKDHVNMGFKIDGLSKEEIAKFQGNGKTMRHLEIHSLADIDTDKIISLMKLVKD